MLKTPWHVTFTPTSLSLIRNEKREVHKRHTPPKATTGRIRQKYRQRQGRGRRHRTGSHA